MFQAEGYASISWRAVRQWLGAFAMYGLGVLSSSAVGRRRRHSLSKTIGFLRQAQPRVHSLLPHRKGRRGKTGVGKRTDGDPVIFRGAVALPIDVAAAVRAEVKADLEPAIGHARVDLVLALDPYLGLQPAAARMDDHAGAARASLAVAHIDMSSRLA